MRLSATPRALQRIESTCSKTILSSRRHQHSFTTASRQIPISNYNNHHVRPSSCRSAILTTPSPKRTIHTTPPPQRKRSSLAHNNEPVPESPPKTDFSHMDMLGQTPIPSVSIDVCMHDGFQFNSGAIISHGDGALLVGGEAFVWRPWSTTATSAPSKMINPKGQFEISKEALGVFALVWPRPDLLIVGTGKEIRPLSAATRRAISELGMRVDVMDTRNAASQFNLLATERGVDDVAGVMVPLGWRDL